MQDCTATSHQKASTSTVTAVSGDRTQVAISLKATPKLVMNAKTATEGVSVIMSSGRKVQYLLFRWWKPSKSVCKPPPRSEAC